MTVAGAQQVTVNWIGPSSVSLRLPSSPAGYQVSPTPSSRLSLSSSGHLVSNGQLQASDAGTYTIRSPDFTGTLNLTLRISGELMENLFYDEYKHF